MIQPGGDPDAGMPADQAELHGIERQPTVQSHAHTNEQDLPPNEDPNVDDHPPVSNDPTDQPPVTVSPNEQDQPPIRTSPAKQDQPPLADAIDDIDEDMDNTLDSNKNVTSTAPPDSV